MEAKIELRGRFLNGGSTAVVGGGGEGKTFLMNILAGYKSDYKVGGSYNYVCKQVTSTLRLIYWIQTYPTTLNGFPRIPENLETMLCYVQQNEALDVEVNTHLKCI